MGGALSGGMLHPHEHALPDFDDDEPTVIEVRGGDLAPAEPPALPFPLRRRKSGADEAWLADLPDSARAVLESARRPAESWPRVSRVSGAVALPAKPIPALTRRS